MWISKKCIFLNNDDDQACFNISLDTGKDCKLSTPFQDTTTSSELKPTNNFYLFIIWSSK